MKIVRNIFNMSGLLLSGSTALNSVLKFSRSMSFRNKVVVITGGSRGLGLVMARQLAAKGAKLALLARDIEEMKVASEELSQKTEVSYFVCDVRDENQVNEAINKVIEEFGTIDVLINNAGVIEVGPFDTMSIADFRNSMDNHFFASLYTIFAVLPTMKEKKFGRIVNISSIGGKISVPHLLPYCTSKFALAGFSEGLRVELSKDDIFVTSVCPGLMRTGSHLHAEFKGQNELEYALFSNLNALPIISTAAEDAAKQILEACRTGEAELIISFPAAVASVINTVFPGQTREILSLVNKLLPKTGGIESDKKKGMDSQSKYSPSILTEGIEKAAEKNNQLNKTK